ncbi:MAG: hypothetical protein M3R08_10105, partial [Bacteroidota bacterium]|nr:hypothetical protein [Bacteroidota bacterium]
MIRYTLLILLLAMAIIPNDAQAGHIIGGELYYDHLGGDQYQVTLTLYRDCNGTGAEFDATGRITVYTGSGI